MKVMKYQECVLSFAECEDSLCETSDAPWRVRVGQADLAGQASSTPKNP